jgi:aminodeoxychorismate synthase component I
LAKRLGAIEADSSPQPPARLLGEAQTSLPREDYLRAVERIRTLIAEGEIYQANLCQRISAEYAGDEFVLYRELARGCPAPRSAFFETEQVALASVSPETFITMQPPDRIGTHPIKGTRPRGFTPEEDDAERRALLASEKDRAELLMIVDLERNDLGRICRTATVEVPELLALQTFPAVHHLVARVEGRLRRDVGASRLIRAMFPGGSITGAPKIRAMEVLSRIEPARRSFFTGSLLWFGDDGSVDSSILIRTVEFRDGRAYIGAGGGIVADSDAEQEWRESIHKASALTRALGFTPEDAR